MRTKDIKIAIAVSQKARVPLMIWGGVGVSKTQQVRQYSKITKQHVEILVGSAVDPIDIIGHFIADRENFSTIQTKPQIYKTFENKKRGLIFLDEYNNSPREVRAVFLKLIDERVLGCYRLSKKIHVVAACNPSSVATNAEYLDIPNRARFVHVELKPDWVDLLDYVEGRAEESGRVLKILSTKIDKNLYKNIFTEAILYCSSNNLPIAKSEIENESEGVLTFRTLDFFARIYTVLLQNHLQNSPIAIEMGRGCIGQSSIGLLQHLKKFKPPSFNEILQDMSILLNREVFAFCVNEIVNNLNREEILEIFKFLRERNANTELTVLAQRIKENVDKIENVKLMKEIYNILNK